MDETTTAAVPRASFLEIPTEIRCIILKNLFRNAMVFIRERVDDRDGIHKDNRSFYIKISAGYCRSVLQSCKQLNEEASKVLESSLTLNCDGALLHRVLSTPPVMRYAKHIRHIEFIGLPDIGPECFDAFTNLRVLKIDEAWKARVNDMLPYAEDEKDVKKQLEGSCDEELKQKWKKRLLKSDSFRKTMEHANRKFKIRYRGYAEADGPSQEADETKYQSLTLVYNVNNLRTVKRVAEDGDVIKKWERGLVKTFRMEKKMVDTPLYRGPRIVSQKLLETIPWERS